MESAELITKVTVWLATAGYVLTVGIFLARNDSTPARLSARLLWTFGCGAMSAHVAAAFHFYHAWSHDRATAQTAAETAAVIGWDWGGGIWLNYLLLALWLSDVAWWWVSPNSHAQRPGWVTAALHAYFAFLFFNAIVVFEEGMLRLLGIAVTAGLCAVWWKNR